MISRYSGTSGQHIRLAFEVSKGLSFLLDVNMTCLPPSQKKVTLCLCPAHALCGFSDPVMYVIELLCALCRASCDTAMAAAAITACSAIRLLPFTSAVFVRSSDPCHGSTTRRRFQSWRVCSSPKPSSGVLTSDGGSANELVPAAVTTPFHLAIPVHDVHAAREFFGEVLGCPEGRSAKTWVDFNLFGHQVVCHEVRNYNASSSANAVDGDPVPVPHFGLAMSVPEFHAMAERVRAAGIKFIIEPHLRFVGQPGEQWTMFFKDYSGNALEFKAMTTPSNLFAKYVVE